MNNNVFPITRQNLGSVIVSDSLKENESIAEAEIIVITLHDGVLHKSLEKEIKNPIVDFSDFLLLEQDIGTKELAYAIVRCMPKTVYIEVQLPRGLVDINRTLKHAVFPHLPDRMEKALVNLHKEATQIIECILHDAVSAKMVLDLHTMCPGNPSISKSIPTVWNQNAMREHIAHWNDAAKRRDRPDVCIIDSLQNETIVGNRFLADLMMQRLHREGWKCSLNNPYAPTIDKHQGHQFIKRRHGNAGGIALDFSKVILCDFGIQNDLTTCTPSHERIDHVAQIIVEVIESYVSNGGERGIRTLETR